MYERSAIVLERYFEKIFGFDKENNIKTNYKNYEQIVKVVKEYKKTSFEEEEVMEKFDEIASEIETIQKRQTKIHEQNLEIESERDKLFNDLGENPSILDTRLQKLETTTEKNVEELKDLRIKYVKSMVLFTERQKERNKYARIRRTAEAEFRNQVMIANRIFEAVNKSDIKNIQDFIEKENYTIEQKVLDLMIKNGKSERVPFNNKALEKAVKARVEIAKREAELYMNIYSKTKKILDEIENDTVKVQKPEKLIKDTSVKLLFLEAEKEYIVMFLDNERMTSINGPKTHEKLMEEACENFDEDMVQIDNLYKLILSETKNKTTIKMYNELYDKNYLKQIEMKERDFQKEATSVKVNLGTVINSNYWRIEGIKNIYKVFQQEVSEKFGKDLSSFTVEEIEEYLEEKDNVSDNDEDEKDKLLKVKKQDYDLDSIMSKYNDDEQDDNDYADDEYDDEEYDGEEYDDEEYDDEEYDDEEYDDEEYDDEEYDDEEYDDEEYDDEEDDEKENIEENTENFEEKYENYFNNVIKFENINKEEKDNYIIDDDVNNDDLTEEEIDEIIRRSRQRRHSKRNRRDKEDSKGLFRKIF